VLGETKRKADTQKLLVRVFTLEAASFPAARGVWLGGGWGGGLGWGLSALVGHATAALLPILHFLADLLEAGYTAAAASGLLYRALR